MNLMSELTFNSWNKVIIAGGYCDDNRDDILEYDPEEDTMITVGHMTQARAQHAVSVIQAEDYLQWCQWRQAFFARSHVKAIIVNCYIIDFLIFVCSGTDVNIKHL